jgi:hypothetical protein
MKWIKNMNVCDVRTQGIVRDDASSHVHCVVPAGGLAPDHSRWVTQIAAAQKIVPNAAGNVFVPGTIVNSDVSAGPSDYLITKLSPSGTVVFQSRFSPATMSLPASSIPLATCP